MPSFVGLDVSPSHSALVLIPEDGGTPTFFTFSQQGTMQNTKARMEMARKIFDDLWGLTDTEHIGLIALEDYDQNPHQQVAYQIAEVSGVLKFHILDLGWPLVLVNPRKVKSYVARQKSVPKALVIKWAQDHGLPLPPKSPGQPGLYADERGDVADAFVLASIAKDTYSLAHDPRTYPVKGSIILDPSTGLLYRPDLLINLKPIGVTT